MSLVKGTFDLHMHTAPDVVPRKASDIEAAKEAAAAGMAGIMMKNHNGCTAERAALVQEVVPGIKVFGSTTLNWAVGGFNPVQVEVAARLGAKEVWMPTQDAAHQRTQGQHFVAVDGPKRPPLRIWDDAKRVLPEVHEVLEVMAKYDLILGTGHLSIEETLTLVPLARQMGVRRIVITHPEINVLQMAVPVQVEMRRHGVLFERCLISTTPLGGSLPFEIFLRNIRGVGCETTLLATDYGQALNPSPVEGMADYIQRLLVAGFKENEIDLMARTNPAAVLGLV